MAQRIDKQVEIPAPLPRVWRALTDYREFGEWFLVKMDGPFVAGEAVSGNITLTGWEHLRMEIVVQAIEPQTYFSYTWHPYAIDPGVDYGGEPPTLVEFRLQPTAVGTLLRITETGFENLPAHRIADCLAMNESGWAQQAENIKAYVAKHP